MSLSRPWILAIGLVLVGGIAVFAFHKSPQVELRKRSNRDLAAVERPPQNGVNNSAVALPPSGIPVRDVLSSLRAPALAGSARAACRIAQELQRCAAIGTNVDLAETLNQLPAEAAAHLPVKPSEVLAGAERASEICSGVSTRETYRFQRIAANGGNSDFQRWLIINPAIDQANFLDHLDDWEDYRARAESYVKEAIRARRTEDLELLLSIYAPSDASVIRPPYKVDDPFTFVALLAVAESLDMRIPAGLIEARDRIVGTADSQERGLLESRLAQLSTGWRADVRPVPVTELFSKAGARSFCE